MDADPRAQLDKVLSLELQQGCRDCAVIGGLAAFVARRETSLPPPPDAGPAWTELFSEYHQLRPARRRRLVKQLRRAFSGDTSPEPKSPSPSPADAPLRWDDPLERLSGVGPRRAELLRELGLETVGDLLCHAPVQHEDRAALTPLSEARARQELTALVRVTAAGRAEYRRRPPRATVPAADETMSCDLVWYGQPYMARNYHPEDRLLVRGQARCFSHKVEILVQHVEKLEPGEEATLGVVPLYRTIPGLSENTLRTWVQQALERCPEIPEGLLPPAARRRHGGLSLAEAIPRAHLPENLADAEAARDRLLQENLFAMQVLLARRRRHLREEVAGTSLASDGVLEAWQEALPFPLTSAQQRVAREILADLEAPYPMYRLLHGDVGAGKTVVAGVALLAAARAGRQAALMAPTELLAEQHYRVLSSLFARWDLPVLLLSGSLSAPAAFLARRRLAAGEALLVVGTHALFQEGVQFADLALAVVDEQHRFGVRQRARLTAKGSTPNLLVMSATPIPRTLALTAWGDFELSVLDELPPGRRPVFTQVISRKQRRQAYSQLVEKAHAEQRAFVVCAAIEEDDQGRLTAAEELYEALEREVPGLQWGLVHGRLDPALREARMQAFRRGEIQALVATSVVEVGVDVPEATLMIVENAERFGLAQLHQLRGRIARAQAPANCYLVARSANPEALERLQVLERTTDGFEIAQADLERRGPGEFLGARQSGFFDSGVSLLAADSRLLVDLRERAFALVEADPELELPEHEALRAYLQRAEPRAEEWTL